MASDWPSLLMLERLYVLSVTVNMDVLCACEACAMSGDDPDTMHHNCCGQEVFDMHIILQCVPQQTTH